MKKIKTSDITTTVGMPIKSGSIDHLQNAYSEAIDALVKRILGNGYDPTKVYILYGVEDQGAIQPLVNVSAGAVFYNGEVYQVPAASFTLTGTNVPIANITTTYYSGTNADPVTFTDSTPRNVHEIRQVVIGQGASGSGLVNFANLVPTYAKWVEKWTPTQISNFSGTGTWNTCQVLYRRNGNIVHVSFIATSTSGMTPYASAGVFDITLPFAADLTTANNAGINAVALAELASQAHIVGTNQINSTSTSAKMRLYFSSASTIYKVMGQITYPCI